MDTLPIVNQFERMGARIRFDDQSERPARYRRFGRYAIDIGQDRKGELFEFRYAVPDLKLTVLHTDRQDRHLVLLVDSRDIGASAKTSTTWQKFLCGHDERHWFVAGVNSRCTNVWQAKESLKPAGVIDAQHARKVRHKNWQKRHNDGFIRQGEWFFVPVEDVRVNALTVFHNEPLMRGGKPHVAEYLTRTGGETVYVSQMRPNGVSEDEYRDLMMNVPETRNHRWRVMRRNPEVLVKGTIRHSDHKTVVLDSWHRVLSNREVMTENVAFLD